MKKFLLFAVLLIGLLGCNAPPIQHGVVTGHSFVPEHTDTIWIPMNMGDTFVLMPMPSYVPDTWQIRVKSDTEDREEWIHVSKETYEKLKLGDKYTKP